MSDPVSSEISPLLVNSDDTPSGIFSPLRRVLLLAFVCAISIAFTQTSLIYAFRVMTCDDYFDAQSPVNGQGDRCSIPIIESSTAKAIAAMSTMTSFCSILNLFVTGYWFKKIGIKTAMFQQTFWAALRSLAQIYALSIGGPVGIKIITSVQTLNTLGSGGGYELASMAYIAELCVPKKRTGMFGVLMGVRMLGAAVGYIFGGMAYDYGGMLLPFQIACGLFVFTTILGYCFLPYIHPSPSSSNSSTTSFTSFLQPLRMFLPHRKLVGINGRMRWDFNLFMLGLGAFFSVLATGYMGTGLQLVATNVFGFTPGSSGLAVSLSLAIRAIFLSIMFPRIIAAGRKWLSPSSTGSGEREMEFIEGDVSNLIPTPLPADNSTDYHHGSRFDLIFLQTSILVDGILTAAVSLASTPWHMYLAAAVLPFASGTGTAVKGVVMDLVGPEEKADALSAIALIEKLAQVSTISLFGYIFSSLSGLGYPMAVFLVNGAIAMIGFMLLLFVRMPRRQPIALE